MESSEGNMRRSGWTVEMAVIHQTQRAGRIFRGSGSFFRGVERAGRTGVCGRTRVDCGSLVRVRESTRVEGGTLWRVWESTRVGRGTLWRVWGSTRVHRGSLPRVWESTRVDRGSLRRVRGATRVDRGTLPRVWESTRVDRGSLPRVRGSTRVGWRRPGLGTRDSTPGSRAPPSDRTPAGLSPSIRVHEPGLPRRPQVAVVDLRVGRAVPRHPQGRREDGRGGRSWTSNPGCSPKSSHFCAPEPAFRPSRRRARSHRGRSNLPPERTWPAIKAGGG